MIHKLTVLVAFASWHVGARVVTRLANIPGIEIVAQACTPEAVIELSVREQPQLIILDHLLSGGIGHEVLTAIRGTASKPIVMMTSTSGLAQYRREAFKEGVDFFFHLPDETGGLCAAVAGLVKTPPDWTIDRLNSVDRPKE